MTHYLVICDDGEIEVSHHTSEAAARSALMSELCQTYGDYEWPAGDDDAELSLAISDYDLGLTYQIGEVEVLA